ncbi:nucleoside hydrolase [Vibrio vulnificus]
MNNVKYPTLSLTERAKLLDVPNSGEKLPVVIDSDTANEIDDQFAIAWALLHPERIDLQAIYAAPFTNSMFEDNDSPISCPKSGMEMSYNEIHEVINKVSTSIKPKVFKGATRYLKNSATPEVTPATKDLIERSKNCDGTLYVISIGAPTNLASAILQDPSIIERIHVLWLGGNSYDWENTYEYNMLQDIDASRVILNSGVALTQFPCFGVTNTLATSVPEIQYYLNDTSVIGSYLSDSAPNCEWIGFGNRKVIWDIAPVGFLLNPEWFTDLLVPSPILNDNFTYSFDNKRHLIRTIKFIERDELFIDLFKKLIKG